MNEFDINDNNMNREADQENTVHKTAEAPQTPEEVSSGQSEELSEKGELVYDGENGKESAETQPVFNQPNQPAPQQQNYRPYQQPYQIPFNQNYGSQPSMGYYQPHTNEYIYSPTPSAKKSNVGKIAIICIAAVLAVFIFSVGIYSVLTLDQRYSINQFSDNLFANKDGTPINDDDDYIDDHRNDSEVEGGDNETPSPAQNAVASPQQIRDYPSLEQLAAPEDAMSLPDIYDKVIKSVVGVSCYVEGGTQTGTGFVIDADEGYIVTNAHVIEDYINVMIVDLDLNEYEAEVIGYDTQTDIAVLRIDPTDRDLVAVELGISSNLRIGELAIAIGNPLGFDLYGTMTTGIISGLDRTVTISDNTMTLLQTSASINNGNSGGPLIDAYGRVIGITSAKVASTYGESLGFAIPIDEAIPIIENLIEYGYVIGRPSIGISGRDITELLSLYWRLPQGVLVHSVTPGSGAEAAGILPEDVIIGIQGQTITNMNELNNIKNQYSVGDTVTLTIYRIVPQSDSVGRSKGESFDVDVVLGESTPE